LDSYTKADRGLEILKWLEEEIQALGKESQEIKNKLNQFLPGLFDKDGKLDENKLTELKNSLNSQEKHSETDLKPADYETIETTLKELTDY